MIVITSQSYGDITIPFTERQSEKYSANVPMYARDNTSNNVRDSVGSGAIIKPSNYNFNGILTNNDGGILHDYDIEETRQKLVNVYKNSELLVLSFGQTETFALFAAPPIVIPNVVISDMEIDADNNSGATYNITISFIEQILVDSIYNPDVVNVPANTSAPGPTDRQKKGLSPQNNGTSSPVPNPIDSNTINNDWSNFIHDF